MQPSVRLFDIFFFSPPLLLFFSLIWTAYVFFFLLLYFLQGLPFQKEEFRGVLGGVLIFRTSR